MPPMTVNMDALIKRADLYDAPVQSIDMGSLKSNLSISDLHKGEFLFESLRKPDFQRETRDWEPSKISDLIASFAEGDLIPAIIFWRHGDLSFVVDGAHRLGALIAWINDDYGDGKISRDFFGDKIPDEQKQASEQTRKLVDKRIAPYREIRHAASNPDTTNSDQVRLARRLSAYSITIQWVSGDAKKVEEAFKKINQKAAPIDKTELLLIDNRKKPNAIAARAVHHAGKGNEYWKIFPDEQKSIIQSQGNDIFNLLFLPNDRDYIKNFEAPVGGLVQSANALPMILEFINTANEFSGNVNLPEDHDGQKTALYLKKSLNLAKRITGMHPSSLGLHSFVYFYSPTGKHQPVLFQAICSMISTWSTDKFIDFTRIRKDYEEYIVENKRLVSQIIRKYGSKGSGRTNIIRFYNAVIDSIINPEIGSTVTDSVMKNDSSFSFLQPNENIEIPTQAKEFSNDTKHAVIIRESFNKTRRCGICGGFLSSKSMTIDHIQDKRQGGLGESSNAQLSHPFCNSTAKDILLLPVV